MPTELGTVQVNGCQGKHQPQAQGHPAPVGLHIAQQMQQGTALCASADSGGVDGGVPQDIPADLPGCQKPSYGHQHIPV